MGVKSTPGTARGVRTHLGCRCAELAAQTSRPALVSSLYRNAPSEGAPRRGDADPLAAGLMLATWGMD